MASSDTIILLTVDCHAAIGEAIAAIPLVLSLCTPLVMCVCMCVCEVFARGLLSRGAGGAIVNLSSQASTRAITNLSVYCTSKAAVDQLTRSLASELGPHQVSVNLKLALLCLASPGPRGKNRERERERERLIFYSALIVFCTKKVFRFF